MPSAKVSGIAWYAVVSHPITPSFVQTGRKGSFEGSQKVESVFARSVSSGSAAAKLTVPFRRVIGQLPIMRGR